jgi:hypothetical protein
MEKDLHNLIAVLVKLNDNVSTTAAPKRERSLARKVLDSKEVEHLSKYIIKVTLWPKTQYLNGWLKEIRTSLDNLAFGLSKFSKRIGTKRYIDALWYSATDLFEHVNQIHIDAYWAVIEDMEKDMLESIEYDPFNEMQDLADIGYQIKETRDPEKGLTFSLWLKDEKIV